MIQMKYPKIPGNDLCDGRTHSIKPNHIESFNINRETLYLLDYVDFTIGASCTTVLRQTPDGFRKVPLLDYDDLKDRIRRGIIILRPVRLDVLNNVRTIEADEPIRNISMYNAEARKEEQQKPPQQVVRLMIDENGTIYIDAGAARVLFGINQRSQYYPINQRQLEFLLANYAVEWFKLNTKSDFVTTIKTLDELKTALRQVKKYKLAHLKGALYSPFSNKQTIYVVIQLAEHKEIRNGTLNLRGLYAGTPAFKYEDGVYKKWPSTDSKPYTYLKNLLSEIEMGESIPIDEIEPLVTDDVKYEFVGGYGIYATAAHSIENLDISLNSKVSFSDATMGYDNSKCRCPGGIYVDDLLTYDINIKELKELATQYKNHK